ncbi:MAG: hypothetical protein ACQGVK_04665 [Myxococcota bacterium]
MVERRHERRRAARAASAPASAALGLIALGLIGLGLIGVGVLIPEAARAGELERDCAEVDRSRRTSCQLERELTGEWVLTTRLVVGSGAKAGVSSLEQRFCNAMVSRGRAARVTRWSALPGSEGQAAKMEWRCGGSTPAVSSGPPSQMPRYGGAYLR